MLDPDTQAFCDYAEEFAADFYARLAILKASMRELDYQIWAMNERLMDKAAARFD